MSLPHASVSTLDGIQLIDLAPADISPYLTQCDIKAFYLGKNRNGSFIDEETATKMAKTLRGNPIVGAYKKDKQDFSGHGDVMTIDDQGIHFSCETQPYGFVPNDAKIWFQQFDDEDEFGNITRRKYLMTTGYLWTGLFPQAQQVIDDGGKPQSMELKDNSVKGHWAEDSKTGMEFFIINDANISKLCILGDDVEPCFEGASITSSEINNTFSKIDNNTNFVRTLYALINRIEKDLQGGNRMQNENVNQNAAAAPVMNPQPAPTEFTATPVAEPAPATPNAATPAPASEESAAAIFTATEGNINQTVPIENVGAIENKFTHTDEEFTELETKFNELNSKFEALEAANKELTEFKNKVEDEQKDALINEFYMLSDEDKKDVVENKSKYSLDDIKSKLSVICFEKKVNFVSNDGQKNDNNTADVKPVVNFNLNNNMGTSNSMPDWAKAIEARRSDIKENR